MEDISTLERSGTITERQIRGNSIGSKLYPERMLSNPFMDRVLDEGGENFIHYLNWSGIINETEMLVLSSKYHYYYECDDFKGVNTLINLRKLNFIKHLDSFIHLVNNIVSPKTNFIGCFYDRNTQNRNALFTRIHKRFINFLDSKVFIEMDKKNVSKLMESNGFKVIDMTEINGVTYFITQNNSKR